MVLVVIGGKGLGRVYPICFALGQWDWCAIFCLLQDEVNVRLAIVKVTRLLKVKYVIDYARRYS